METVLGIRAVAEGFTWAVVEGEVEAPILIGTDRVLFPSSFEEPAALGWCRNRLQLLLDDYKPQCVAVRLAEAIARSANSDSARRRNRVEGVLLEGTHAKGIAVHTAAMATMSKNLGVKSAKVLLADTTLRGLDWSKYNDHAKEAILVAVAALGR